MSILYWYEFNKLNTFCAWNGWGFLSGWLEHFRRKSSGKEASQMLIFLFSYLIVAHINLPSLQRWPEYFLRILKTEFSVKLSIQEYLTRLYWSWFVDFSPISKRIVEKSWSGTVTDRMEMSLRNSLLPFRSYITECRPTTQKMIFSLRNLGVG